MELRHLRYFVAVAETLNYRKASELLHVSQPTLSSQIQDLEFELGVRLLDRNTRGVRLTDSGAAFLKAVRAALAKVQDATDSVRNTQRAPKERLVIGYTAPLLVRLMPPGLRAFAEKFPDIDIVLSEKALPEQLAAVEAGAIQIGFALRLALEPALPCPHAQILRSPMRAVVSRNHPLAAHRQIALAELAKEQILCLAPILGTRNTHEKIMRRIFDTRALRAAPFREVDGMDVLRVMVETGRGVSITPGFGGMTQSRQIAAIPLADSGDDLLTDLLAVWREDRTTPLLQFFVECMRQAASQEILSAPGHLVQTAVNSV